MLMTWKLYDKGVLTSFGDQAADAPSRSGRKFGVDVPHSHSEPTLRFGVFDVNLAAREIRKHGIRIRLPGQPFAILAMLLQRPGEIVTREEMREILWAADTFVDFEHGLNSAIKKLRAALGDSPENPLYVETLPRIGYRFIAPVNTDMASAVPPSTSELSIRDSLSERAHLESSQPRLHGILSGRQWFALLVSALGVLAVVLTIHFFYGRKLPVLRDKNTIVLADFENITREPIFDETLRQGLAVALEQSPQIQIVSDRKSAVILKQMGRSPDERLTGQMVIELCQRAGSKVMVQGSIASMGTVYLIGLTAIRCDNGDTVAHEQSEAKDKEDIIRALGEAATRLRKRLGESIPSVQKYNAPLEQATTTSLAALKAYGMAVSTYGREGDRAAIPLFNEAIERDPSFALAYGQLATIYQNLGETQLARQNATKAFQNRERLTESERALIEAWYNSIVTGDLEKATQLFELQLKNYPPSVSVLNDLGVGYVVLGRHEKATELLRDAIRLDPDGATTYANLALTLLASDQIDEANAVLEQADKQKLRTDDLLETHYLKAFLQGNSREMEEILSQASDLPGARPLLLSEQARTEAYFGRFQKSRESSKLAARMMEQQADNEAAASCLAELAIYEAEVGSHTQAREHALDALRQVRSQTVVTLVALVMAQTGDLKRAQALVKELNKNYPSDTLIQKYWLPTIRARMELRQRNWSKALETLSVAEPFDFAAPPALAVSPLYPAYVRGEIYLSEGDGSRAVAEFSRLIERRGMVLNFPLGALAHLGRARAYALTGDLVRARESYQEFFRLWKGADSDLSLLKNARGELSKLAQASSISSVPAARFLIAASAGG
jgi:eukaryotic-like serine/threonine-protein kinase